MSAHVQFGTEANTPDTGSVFPIGTAFLRSTPGVNLTGASLIAVGKCESLSLKTTGDLIELEDENASTEAVLKLNTGEDCTIKARFTKDVPAPRDFQFIAIRRRRSTLGNLDPQSGLNNLNGFNDTTVDEVFLITEVGEDYGSKEVAKYNLTCRRWDSLAAGTRTATVNTASGEVEGNIGTYPVSPVIP